MASTVSFFSKGRDFTDEECHFHLRKSSVEFLTAIERDSSRRREGFREDLHLLGKGVFYLDEYFDALTEMKQTPRINFFKKKDSFFHGFASPKHFHVPPPFFETQICV